MGTTDDTLKALNRLEKTIEEQRELLLQAHGVLTCLYEVLLHAECEEAVSYAQATYVARSLVDRECGGTWTRCGLHRCSTHSRYSIKSRNR